MQIVAAMQEYRHHLEHLDRIRISFFTYHRSDADIEIVEEDLIYKFKAIPVINTTMR